MPKLAALAPRLAADPSLKLLTWNKPYEAQYLTRLGISLSQVVTYDPEATYSAWTLLYPTPVPRITPAREALWAARKALGVRSSALDGTESSSSSAAAAGGKGAVVVWVSRADEPDRHVANEAEVLDSVRAAMGPEMELVYFTRMEPQVLFAFSSCRIFGSRTSPIAFGKRIDV